MLVSLLGRDHRANGIPTNVTVGSFLRRAKGREKPYKIGWRRLFVLINPNGKCFWRLAYRFSGKQKALALGVYPAISLADARGARSAAKEQLAKGIDPGEARKLEKQAMLRAAGNSFEAIAREWHENPHDPHRSLETAGAQ